MRASRSKQSGKILITGGTGFLGKALLAHLKEKGEKDIRVLTTSAPSWLNDDHIEVIEGSITSPEIVDVAVEGVKGIYHLAGKVSRNKDDQRSMYAVHIDGTRILCETAKKHAVKRIVMASSSGTIAITEDGIDIPDEDYPTPIELITRLPYYASKLYQEKTARNTLGPSAVELVMVNPSLLLGPGDDRLSSTQDVLKFLARDIPAIPPGGINFVDVRDAAPVFHAAMQKGRAGDRYLLGGPNWSMERFFKTLERVSKTSAPKVKIPQKLHSPATSILQTFYERIGKEAPVDETTMEMSRYFWYLDASKAQRELGFVSRDPSETLFDTVQYLRKNFLGAGLL